MGFFRGEMTIPGGDSSGIFLQRSLLFCRNAYLVIRDRLEGRGEFEAELRLHLHTRILARVEGDRVICSREGGPVAEFRRFGSGSAPWELGEGVVSPGYGEELPSSTVRILQKGIGTLDFITLVDFDPEAHEIEALATVGALICLQLTEGGRMERVFLECRQGARLQDSSEAMFPLEEEAEVFRLVKDHLGDWRRAEVIKATEREMI
jgi:hypothetical protein